MLYGVGSPDGTGAYFIIDLGESNLLRETTSVRVFGSKLL